MLDKTNLNKKFRPAMTFAALWLILLAIFAYLYDPKQYPTNYIIWISGCVFGWLVGIVTTPYDNKDRAKTETLTKLIGSFLSGFLISKLDKLLDEKTLLSSISGSGPMRTLLFFCCFSLGWIVVYIFRSYFTPQSQEEPQKQQASYTEPA